MKELQMLRSGLDTLSIASKTGQTEAQVWNAITRQRKAEGKRPARRTATEKQANKQRMLRRLERLGTYQEAS